MAEAKVHLLTNSSSSIIPEDDTQDHNLDMAQMVWTESKKLWHVAGPSLISRLATYSTLVITQASAGHLGDTELAAVSIVITVIFGFCFGLLLGMASSLETLCGQAFGAKKYDMLGVYLQRSWIVLFLSASLLLPIYIFATPILKLLGQPQDIAELTGTVSIWMIPMHFCIAFQFPLQRFLQSQRKTAVLAYVSVAGLAVHIILSWVVIPKFEMGLVGVVVAVNFTWCLLVLGTFCYAVFGGCPLSWTGFSVEAFSGLGEFLKLSVASGVMLCLENWYYRILILMAGNLKNAEIAIDALSVCMNINGWEMMLPLALFAGAGVRVANELGADNGKGAKFAMLVSVTTSVAIGLFFSLLILLFYNKLALIFTTSKPILEAVSHLSILLALTILLNSIQPVLSGVAVGLRWQSSVAYINLACYYLVGLPLGIVMGWVFGQGVTGIWAGMVLGGTAVQTIALVIIISHCDWDKEASKAAANMSRIVRKT